MPTTDLPISDELGALISEHHSRPSARRPLRLVLGIACLLGGIAAGGLALQRWHFALVNLGPAAVWRHSSLALTAAVILLLAGSLVLLLHPRTLRVEVHHDGLRWSRGRRSACARWSQVREIRLRATRYLLPALGKRTHAELVLGIRPPGTSTRRLRRLHLPHDLSDFDDLAAAVKTQVYPLLLPEMSRALRQGRTLTFGRLRLNSKGVRQGRRMLPWSRLEQVRLEGGVVHLRSAHASGRVELRLHAQDIPNLEVCLQLIEQLSRAS